MIKTALLTMSADGLENVEAGSLQAYLLENGYKSERIHLNLEKDIDEQYACLDLSSKIYNMTVYSESSVYPDSLLAFGMLAKKIKTENDNKITVLGSKFASIYYKEILNDERFSYIDFIILGDAEYTLAALIECVEKNDDIDAFVRNNKNIASKDCMKDKEFLNIDINKLPLPVRTLNTKNIYENYYAFITESHGCCMNCAFCTRGQFYKEWTGRSAESIFYEIKKITIETSTKCFWFIGGSFEDPGGELGVEKIRNFCNLIIKNDLKVSMRCYLRSNFVAKTDIELLKLMKKAGFDVVLVGVESANEFDLKLYNKGTTVEYNRITLRKLKEAGIYADHFGFIMINPYSTPERLQTNFRFLEEYQPHDLDNYVHHMVVDPGTAIRKKVEEDGLLIPTDDFLKQGSSYCFIDPYTAEVSAFLHKYFLNKETETAGISTFIVQASSFIPNGEYYRKEMSVLMSKRARVFSDYFRVLYIDMDIASCERRYKEFETTVNGINIELETVKNKLIRDLVKLRII